MMIELMETLDKHWGIKLSKVKEMDLMDMVYLIEEEKEISKTELDKVIQSNNIKKIHRITGHKGDKQLHHAFDQAGLLSKEVKI